MSDIESVIYWCIQSWETVKPSTLERAWNKLIDGLSTSNYNWENDDF